MGQRLHQEIEDRYLRQKWRNIISKENNRDDGCISLIDDQPVCKPVHKIEGAMEQDGYKIAHDRNHYLLPAYARVANIAQRHAKADCKRGMTEPAQDDAPDDQHP